MIHLHGNPGMNYDVVLLPDFIRTVAGMHDDRFPAIHQGGIRGVREICHAKKRRHSSLSWQRATKVTAESRFPNHAELRHLLRWSGLSQEVPHSGAERQAEHSSPDFLRLRFGVNRVESDLL
jgi:hypothetical protein